jgi:hypothetical protein
LHTDALVRQSERPGRRPGEKRDEVAAFHLIKGLAGDAEHVARAIGEADARDPVSP